MNFPPKADNTILGTENMRAYHLGDLSRREVSKGWRVRNSLTQGGGAQKDECS